MKAKSRENEFIFDQKSDQKADEIRFHVLMERRFSSDSKMTPRTWKDNNRFLVHQGGDGGEFFAYVSCERFNEDDASNYLRDRGYVSFRAAGSIDSVSRVIRFERPTDPDICIQLIRKITFDDERLVQYYRGFGVIVADGRSLGKMELHWFPE